MGRSSALAPLHGGRGRARRQQHVQLRWPDFAGGANRPSLVESQRNVIEHRVMEARFAGNVLPASPDEPIDPGWKPSEESDDLEVWAEQRRLARWPYRPLRLGGHLLAWLGAALIDHHRTNTPCRSRRLRGFSTHGADEQWHLAWRGISTDDANSEVAAAHGGDMSQDDDPEEQPGGRLDRVIMSRGCLWAFTIAFALLAGLALLVVLTIVALSQL
jgi:hypothetical protein